MKYPTAKDHKKILHLWESGSTYREIAREVDRSRRSVMSIVRRNQIVGRATKRPRPIRRGLQPLTEIDHRIIIFRDGGLTMQQIAGRLSISKASVEGRISNMLKRGDIQRLTKRQLSDMKSRTNKRVWSRKSPEEKALCLAPQRAAMKQIRESRAIT